MYRDRLLSTIFALSSVLAIATFPAKITSTPIPSTKSETRNIHEIKADGATKVEEQQCKCTPFDSCNPDDIIINAITDVNGESCDYLGVCCAISSTNTDVESTSPVETESVVLCECVSSSSCDSENVITDATDLNGEGCRDNDVCCAFSPPNTDVPLTSPANATNGVNCKCMPFYLCDSANIIDEENLNGEGCGDNHVCCPISSPNTDVPLPSPENIVSEVPCRCVPLSSCNSENVIADAENLIDSRCDGSSVCCAISSPNTEVPLTSQENMASVVLGECVQLSSCNSENVIANAENQICEGDCNENEVCCAIPPPKTFYNVESTSPYNA